MLANCAGCMKPMSIPVPPKTDRTAILTVYCAECCETLAIEQREQRAAWEADLRKQLQYDADAEADARAFGLEVDDEDRPVERTGHV
jgi:hypothetical protein